MGRLRLSTALIGINVGLVLLAVVGVALAASGLLQQLADEQGLARVSQAGAVAHRELVGAGESAAITAQILAERPTLRRLLREEDGPALATFLEQFWRTSQLDGCAVIRDGSVVAAAGRPPTEQLSLPAEPGYQIAPLGESDTLTLSASAPMRDDPDSYVLVARHLDGPLTERVSEDIGLPVRVIAIGAAGDPSPRAELIAQALTMDAPAAAHLADADAYVAVHPVRGAAGEIVGVIEVALPTASVTDKLRRLTEILLLLTLAVAALAALGSLLIGRWLVRPLAVLSAAAARIGQGDLATPVPLTSGAESGALAATLEEMRQRLLRLTADLKRQQAEAYAIVAGISEGVFTVDRERRIRYITPQGAALLGISAEQAIGRFCGDVLNPQGPAGVRPCGAHCPIVHARFRNGARATEHLLLPDGRRRTIVITSAAPSEGQQVQVLRDETEQEATRRMRDTVLGNISHEFRTPLSAQLASIELLLDQLPNLSQEQIAQLIRAQQRGTLRLAQLIDNLLESVRIEAGHQALRRQPVALDEIVEAALELMRPLLQQREQAVVLELPYPLPPVQGDAPRLTQVFVNLLANANKFAPERSPISIGGEVQRDTITIWVEDRGPGLPEVAHRALFSRFVRAAAEEPEQSGIGLGLAIVESIVERHGGRVHARNTGTGTRMSVVLPREVSDEDPDSR